jgi:hypothetical protein
VQLNGRNLVASPPAKISAFNIVSSQLNGLSFIYSHSIVAGGLFVRSYTTLVTSGISFVILEEILSKTS